MENYKSVRVNSKITNNERLEKALRTYLNDRIWSDDELLEGFDVEEINTIVTNTLKEYGDEINHFAAVALEAVAKKIL